MSEKLEPATRPGVNGLGRTATGTTNTSTSVGLEERPTLDFELVCGAISKIPRALRPRSKDNARASLPTGRKYAAAYRIGCHMIDTHNWATGRVRHGTSYKHISEAVGYSKRHCIRAIDELERRRWCLTQPRYNARGDCIDNHYTILALLPACSDAHVTTPGDMGVTRCDDARGTTPGDSDVTTPSDADVTAIDTSEETHEVTLDLPSPPSPRLRRRERERVGKDDLLNSLVADGRNRHVVEHLIGPILASLQIDHIDPLSLLRDIRDQTLLADLEPEGLQLLAIGLKRDRKKLVSTKDVMDAYRAILPNIPKHRVYTGSPQFAAWMSFHRAQGNSAAAKFYEQQGYADAVREWPRGFEPALG